MASSISKIKREEIKISREYEPFLLASGQALEVCPARADTLTETVEDRDGGLPVDTGVGDGLAVLQSRGARSGHVLTSLDEVALNHDAHDVGCSVARFELGGLIGE